MPTASVRPKPLLQLNLRQAGAAAGSSSYIGLQSAHSEVVSEKVGRQTIAVLQFAAGHDWGGRGFIGWESARWKCVCVCVRVCVSGGV